MTYFLFAPVDIELPFSFYVCCLANPDNKNWCRSVKVFRLAPDQAAAAASSAKATMTNNDKNKKEQDVQSVWSVWQVLHFPLVMGGLLVLSKPRTMKRGAPYGARRKVPLLCVLQGTYRISKAAEISFRASLPTSPMGVEKGIRAH